MNDKEMAVGFVALGSHPAPFTVEAAAALRERLRSQNPDRSGEPAPRPSPSPSEVFCLRPSPPLLIRSDGFLSEEDRADLKARINAFVERGEPIILDGDVQVAQLVSDKAGIRWQPIFPTPEPK